jgi:hypothetical protein
MSCNCGKNGCGGSCERVVITKQGERGFPGPPGPAGTDGLVGQQGPPGIDGQSIDHSSFTSSTVAPFNIPGLLDATDTYTVWGDAGETIDLGTFIVQNAASRGYLIYVAILTQTGTGNPVAVELENTIGAIVWTRNAAGQYFGTLAGAFTFAKTATFVNNDAFANDKNVISITPANANQIFLNSANTTAPDGALVFSDDHIKATTVEIRVYS